MIFKTEFQLNRSDFSDEVYQEMVSRQRREAAHNLGGTVCRSYPFELKEVVSDNYSPATGLTPDFETYECELFAVRRRDWNAFIRKISRIITTNEESRRNAQIVKNAIADLGNQ